VAQIPVAQIDVAPNLPPPSATAVVIGLGRSGVGAAKLLQSQGRTVCVLESRRSAALEQRAEALRAAGIQVELDAPLCAATILSLAPSVGPVVVSPGIHWDHPELQSLRHAGVNVQGELEPAWQASRPQSWMAITGTNGKTTVTHLLSHLLCGCGIDAPMAGNVGTSAAELVLERQQSGQGLPCWLVVEMSSYQIEACPRVSPRVGIWTTLTPDHLERHGTLDNYRAIKRQLLERSEVRILNGDDPDLRAHADSWDRAVWVSAGARQELAPGIRPDLWIEDGRVWVERHGVISDVLAADALAMPGAHNRQNMVLAVAAGLEAGLDGAAMEAALRSFPGVPHRLELIREKDGVRFYNDSKATNYDAAEVALQALQGPLVVLAGGQAKRGEAKGWMAALRRQAPAVVLYGEAGEAFRELLATHGYDGRVETCGGLDDAVPLAARLACQFHCRGVLLSPACASFDQYSDFEARGDHFRSLVLGL
jgi:UDP-N-acetylmuramoylalanine--D-glutamate ligase